MTRKLLIALVLVGGIVVLDVHTKRWAMGVLAQGFTTHGTTVPMTLAYNQGVAFGLQLPSAGRWLIIGATLVVLVVLSVMFLRASSRDYTRLIALQLVGAGAIGNLIDRVRWNGGVVDFIGPFNFGSMQFPIFNIADMAITTGAILLALSLLREDATISETVADTDIMESDDVRRTDAFSDPLDTSFNADGTNG